MLIKNNKKIYTLLIFTTVNIFCGDYRDPIETVAWAYAMGALDKEQKDKWEEVYQANKDKPPQPISPTRDFLNHFAQGAGQETTKVIFMAGMRHFNKFADPITDNVAAFLFGTSLDQQLTIRNLSRQQRENTRKTLNAQLQKDMQDLAKLRQLIEKNPSYQKNEEAIKTTYFLEERINKINRGFNSLIEQDLNDTEFFVTTYESMHNENIVQRVWTNIPPIIKPLFNSFDSLLFPLIATIRPSAFTKKRYDPSQNSTIKEKQTPYKPKNTEPSTLSYMVPPTNTNLYEPEEESSLI
jgi:hypothetical protein